MYISGASARTSSTRSPEITAHTRPLRWASRCPRPAHTVGSGACTAMPCSASVAVRRVQSALLSPRGQGGTSNWTARTMGFHAMSAAFASVSTRSFPPASGRRTSRSPSTAVWHINTFCQPASPGLRTSAAHFLQVPLPPQGASVSRPASILACSSVVPDGTAISLSSRTNRTLYSIVIPPVQQFSPS